MTNHGSDSEPDIWANTGNPPQVPPTPSPAAPPTPAAPGTADPTVVQPTTPGQVPPTTVQPAAPGPLDIPPPADTPGYSTGPGAPPPRQPPMPPTGGPGGPGGPTGPQSDRPAWLMPAAIGVLVAIVAAGIIFFLTRSDDPDTIATEESTTSITDTAVEAETTLPTETTIATETETTIGVETTISAETTVAPDTTAAPTTAPPSTAAPATTAASGSNPAAPGTALVAGQTYPISSGCTINPIAGFSVTSYLIDDGDPGTLVEQVFDGSSATGNYSEFGLPSDTEGYEDLGDGGFAMIVTRGDNGFEVALNPTGVSLSDCATTGSVTIGDAESGYKYGIVDICTLASPFTMVGYLTEGGRVQMTDNGDGTATVSFDTTELFLGSDPAASFAEAGGRVQVTGQIDASTFDGDTTQAISIDFDNASPRSCGEFETT